MKTPLSVLLLLAGAAVYPVGLAVAALTVELTSENPYGETVYEDMGGGVLVPLGVASVIAVGLLILVWPGIDRTGRQLLAGVAGIAGVLAFLSAPSYGIYLIPWAGAIATAWAVVAGRPKTYDAGLDPRRPEAL